jgi:ArsR family transcriptional regulator, arsenate/arsenite/antimonite-responsive transcriptional repressor / arsenate reductase (thioredoxin)
VRSCARSPGPAESLRLLADPQRWQLLAELARSDRRVGELTELVGKPQNLVSYHLGALRNAGLVTSRRSSADGRDAYYRIDLARCGHLLQAAGAALHPALQLRLPTVREGTPSPGRTPSVLFLCTGNSARSQIAQALLEHLSGHTIRARSAGSDPKPLHANAVRVMAERGVDISGRTTKHLRRYARTRFDRVITLCDKVKEICPEFPGPPTTAHWSMADPAADGENDGSTYPAFQRTAHEIGDRVELLISEMVAERLRTSHSHRRGTAGTHELGTLSVDP